jgi:hypothetical protein
MICCFIQPSLNVRKSSNDRSYTGAAASTSAFAADITVASSTFIYPVLSNWTNAFKTESSAAGRTEDYIAGRFG